MSVLYPRGFKASGVSCGIKSSGELDLALVVSEDLKEIPTAAVFTTNKSAAAPVRLSKSNLDKNGGKSIGVLISSGNANAATGKNGEMVAALMVESVARNAGIDESSLLICSTGLIGIQLPVEGVVEAAPRIVAALDDTEDAGVNAATAIMTTDTFAKTECRDSGDFRVGAIAKGAAMISPNMATMLAVITTDAKVSSGRLQTALSKAVEMSFNRLSIDGCTSTNDTVIALSSGASHVEPDESFEALLQEVCESLANQIALDAEGGSKVIKVTVEGALNEAEALRGARKIAQSQLVKCSFLGEDPYWGRVASELGSCGIEFELDLLAISYQGVVVASEGVSVEFDLALVKRLMSEKYLAVNANLGLGSHSATITTTDLGYGYIDENKGTS